MPAHAALARRRVDGTDGGGGHVVTAPTATKQRKPVVLLRPVPGDSVIHRLWAGTKLIVVAGIGVMLTFYPGWVPIGLVAALLLTTAWLAHIPRGALPSIPRKRTGGSRSSASSIGSPTSPTMLSCSPSRTRPRARCRVRGYPAA